MSQSSNHRLTLILQPNTRKEQPNSSNICNQTLATKQTKQTTLLSQVELLKIHYCIYAEELQKIVQVMLETHRYMLFCKVSADTEPSDIFAQIIVILPKLLNDRHRRLTQQGPFTLPYPIHPM